MRVFVTGGTGLIGRKLVARLLARGDQPVVLSRRPDQSRMDPSWRAVRVVQGDPSSPGDWEAEVGGCDTVVNLVGHNVFGERWNARVKRAILDSRVNSAHHVVAAIGKAAHKPGVLVQASAIGYYGPHGDEELTESSPPGSDFLADVCRQWEAAAEPASALGVRLATVRIGVVLANGDGALKAMTPVYKWLPGGAAPVGGAGSPLAPGNGSQWMSWIHLDDIVGLLLLALDHPDARGPINGVAPRPVRHAEFGKALAKVLHRPFLPVGPPEALLRVVLGEVANVVTHGQRVLPAEALRLGYDFRFPDLYPALQAVFAKPTPVAAETGGR